MVSSLLMELKLEIIDLNLFALFTGKKFCSQSEADPYTKSWEVLIASNFYLNQGMGLRNFAI